MTDVRCRLIIKIWPWAIRIIPNATKSSHKFLSIPEWIPMLCPFVAVCCWPHFDWYFLQYQYHMWPKFTSSSAFSFTLNGDLCLCMPQDPALPCFNQGWVIPGLTKLCDLTGYLKRMDTWKKMKLNKGKSNVFYPSALPEAWSGYGGGGTTS